MTREGRPQPSKPAARNESPWVFEALGRAIKTARTERGIERKDLATATELSYAYLSDIESGRRRPSSKAIFAIAEALDMNPSELMAWTEQLTRRIASEELAGEAAPADLLEASRRATTEPPGVRAPAAPRRSWFGEPLAHRESPGAEPEPAPPSPRGSRRAELDRVLDGLSPEDLDLVLDLAARLAREHRPRR